MEGSETVGLAVPVAMGFVRIVTNARLFRCPMSCEDATACVRSWIQQPVVQVLPCRREHLDDSLRLIAAVGVAGNLTTDAQIAAIALEYGAVIHTADADFARFPGVQWHNPLTGARMRNPGQGLA